MIANEREALVLAKLLKIARVKAEEAGARLANLRAADLRSQSALRLLADAVSSEEAAAQAAETVGFMQLAGFLAGAAQKRAALEATSKQIAAQIELAKQDLDASFAETMKLEHLIESARRAAARRAKRAETARVGEAATVRHGRVKAR